MKNWQHLTREDFDGTTAPLFAAETASAPLSAPGSLFEDAEDAELLGDEDQAAEPGPAFGSCDFATEERPSERAGKAETEYRLHCSCGGVSRWYITKGAGSPVERAEDRHRETMKRARRNAEIAKVIGRA